MDFGISNKKALITGGSSGLGLGAAIALAQEGVQIVVASRSKEKLLAAVNKIGYGSRYIETDLSDPANGTQLVQQTAEILGGLDILICNSGGPKAGGFYDHNLDAYRAALNSNLLSSIALSEAAIPLMEQSNWGRIVAITSLWVRQPSPTLILSNTARTGLTAFMKTMATAVAGKNITVNTVQPGFHKTARFTELNPNNSNKVAEQIPASRIGMPEDFGSVIAFLCSQQANYITGASIPVDGGLYGGLM